MADATDKEATDAAAPVAAAGPRRWPYVTVGLILLAIGLLRGCGDDFPAAAWTQPADGDWGGGHFVGWAADGEHFYLTTNEVNEGGDTTPRLLRIESATGRVVGETAFPPSPRSFVAEPRPFCELPDGRLAIALDDGVHVRRFEDGFALAVSPADRLAEMERVRKVGADDEPHHLPDAFWPVDPTDSLTDLAVESGPQPRLVAVVLTSSPDPATGRALLTYRIHRIDPDTMKSEPVDLGPPTPAGQFTLLPSARGGVLYGMTPGGNVQAVAIRFDDPGARTALPVYEPFGLQPVDDEMLLGSAPPVATSGVTLPQWLTALPLDGSKPRRLMDAPLSAAPPYLPSRPAVGPGGWIATEFVDERTTPGLGAWFVRHRHHRVLAKANAARDGLEAIVRSHRSTTTIFGVRVGPDPSISLLSISPDGRWLLRKPADGSVEMFDLDGLAE